MTISRPKKISIVGDATLGTLKKPFSRLFKSDINGLERLADKFAKIETTININPKATIAQFSDEEWDERCHASDAVVLMLGRNDISDLLVQIKHDEITAEAQTAKIKKIAEQYKQLVTKIRSAHPDTRVIIVTPAYFYFHRQIAPGQYPSASMLKMKPALAILHGDETDVMQKLYTDIFSDLKSYAKTQNNIRFITTATDESAENCLGYNAPYIDLMQETSRKVADAVIKEIETPSDKMSDFTFKHPHEFTDMPSHELLQKINEKLKTMNDGGQKNAGKKIYLTGSKLLVSMANVEDKKQVLALRESLQAALDVLNDPAELPKLKKCIAKVAPGKRDLRTAFVGALIMLVSAAMIAFALIAPNPGSGPIAILGVSCGVVGYGMFNESIRRGSMAKDLYELQSVMSVQEKPSVNKLKRA